MALTKTPIELSSTPSIVDGGNATAITIDSSENVALAGAISIVGGIGELSAPSAFDLAIYGTASGHNGIRFHDVGLLPTNNAGAIIDNDCDLGVSTHRFKDLYLSGGAYLGGTGAANKLDGYEEGDFTPALNAFTGTYTHQRGKYVKVGSLVTASIHIQIATTGGSGNIIVTGLPFTAIGNSNYGGATTLHCSGWATGNKPDNTLVNPGTTNAAFYIVAGQSGIITATLANMGTGNLLCVFVYRTDQ